MEDPLLVSQDPEEKLSTAGASEEESPVEKHVGSLDTTSDETVLLDAGNNSESADDGSDDGSDNADSNTGASSGSITPVNFEGLTVSSGLTDKELSYINDSYSELLRKLDLTVRCTACYENINHTRAVEVYEHPMLRVLVCRKCRNFYADGVFKQDDDGLDEYCRWCANGGELFMCDFCSNGFCKQCIKRNVGRTAVKNASSKKWRCYVCDIKPLKELRALFEIIRQNLEASKKERNKSLSRSDRNSSDLRSKFQNYKRERKKLKKKIPEIVKKPHEMTEMEKYLCNVESLADIFVGQLHKLKCRMERKALDENKSKHKLCKLIKVMGSNLDLMLTGIDDTCLVGAKVEAGSPPVSDEGTSKASSPEPLRKSPKKTICILTSSDEDADNATAPLLVPEDLPTENEVENETIETSPDSCPTSPVVSKRKRSTASSPAGNETKRVKTEDKDGTVINGLPEAPPTDGSNSEAKNCLLNSSDDELALNDQVTISCDELELAGTEEKDEKDAKIRVSRLPKKLINTLKDVGWVSSEEYSNHSTKNKLERRDSLECLLRETENERIKTKSSNDSSAEDSDVNGTKDRIKRRSKAFLKKLQVSESSELSSDEEENKKKMEEIPISKPVGDIFDQMKKSLLETSDEIESEETDDDVKITKVKRLKKKGISSNKVKIHRERPKGYISMKFSSEENTDSVDEKSSSSLDRKPRKRETDSDSTDVLSSDLSDASSADFAGSSKMNKTKRRVTTKSSSDELEDESCSPRKHRKIIRDEDLQQTTKEATQDEIERRKRVAEREEEYKKFFESQRKKDMPDELVLDFDPNTKEPRVVVDSSITSKLKPHQWKGIKFMWNSTIESVDRLVKDHKGGGCILAHCMGLGKTLQVIALVHSILSNLNTNKYIQRVLICAPVNTIRNWMAEFRKWIGSKAAYEVSHLSSSQDIQSRAFKLDEWYAEGGVMIIGYDMFRTLSNETHKKIQGKLKDTIQKCLVNPGADLIICDEGHIIKNEKSILSKALSKIATKRRIVLTGTPLQNNLNEYHCMVQFVKLNLLGSKKEFANRFTHPIEQGQGVDAMPREVKRMKRRAHILHELLDGCVQRLDYGVLKPYLLPKFEYVLQVQMSEVQIKLYYHYLSKFTHQGDLKEAGARLFVDFSALSKIWSHPLLLYDHMKNKRDKDGDGFVTDGSTSDSSISSVHETPKPTEQEEHDKSKYDWWIKIMELEQNDDLQDKVTKLEFSGKMVLLVNILRKCSLVGDKVIVFSHSLMCLDMIEYFLAQITEGKVHIDNSKEPLPDNLRKWRVNRDYVRLDGSVDMRVREKQCKSFNNPLNERLRLFLISTRAGGIGTNLTGANRVIIFDIGWNPAHDTQSLFRVYRFGQTKPSYIYRFVSQGTMEEKIYSRQVAKISTSRRVVDEHQIKRYFKTADLKELYQFHPADPGIRETPIKPADSVFAEILFESAQWIVGYHEHDSLLEHQSHEQLSEEERKAAWEDFENEKKGMPPPSQGHPMQHALAVHQQSGAVAVTATEVTILKPFLEGQPYQFKLLLEKVRNEYPKLEVSKIFSIAVYYTKKLLSHHEAQYISGINAQQYSNGENNAVRSSISAYMNCLKENISRERKFLTQFGRSNPQNLMNVDQIIRRASAPSAQVAVNSSIEQPSTSKLTGAQELTIEPVKKPAGSSDPIILD